MKPYPLGLAVTLATFLHPGASARRTGAAESGTPVSRVVGLLEGLRQRLEEGLKEEEKAFKKFDCWHKEVVSSKTTSNNAATSRLESLQAYIADIDAGKFEFTTERADLENQIKEIERGLEAAAQLRATEEQDYLAAKEEMEQALAALEDAIAALEAGAPTALLARKGLLGIRQSLRRAVELGHSFLGLSDAKLLAREIPTWDWKKLNRKATFKSKYTTRTAEIVALLKKMRTTFEENLEQAEKLEADAVASYNTLKTSKEGMLGTTEQALVALTKENGARDLSKSEAQEEIDALGAQVGADTEFISNTIQAFNIKSDEWVKRQELRRAEITAISEAISVLHSDDARDLFKRSYTSQGYSLLQFTGGAERRSAAQRNAQRELRVLAAATGDQRLLLTARAGTIAAVIEAIDNLVATLTKEEDDDLKVKEDCEGQRADVTRRLRLHSVAIDSFTDDIVRVESEVKDLEDQMKEQEQVLLQLNESKVELTRQREDEARDFAKEQADDQAAVELIGQAITIMEDLQKNFAPPGGLTVGPPGGLMLAPGLLQGSRKFSAAHRQPWEIKAGEAPPPPPATWENPNYEGATAESGGIVSILTLLQEDVIKEISMQEADETAAQNAFTAAKADIENSEIAAQDAIDKYEMDKAGKEGDAATWTTERKTKKEELDAAMTELRAMEPGCDFYLVNFQVRTKNRQVELDGLRRAKQILEEHYPSDS